MCSDALIIELHVEFDDLCDPEISQALAARLTAADAAISQDSVLVPTSSITL